MKLITQLYQLAATIELARGAYVKKLTGMDVSDLIKHDSPQREIAGIIKGSRAPIKRYQTEIKKLTNAAKEQTGALKKAVKGVYVGAYDTNASMAHDPEDLAKRIARGKQATLRSAEWLRRDIGLSALDRLVELATAKFRMNGYKLTKGAGDMHWKSSAATMKPDDFLSKASKLKNPHQPAVDKYRAKIRAGEEIEMPYLRVERRGKGIGHHPANFKVTGHEGRHRMIAAKQEGVARVPVEIRVSDTEPRYPKRSKMQKRMMKKAAFFQPEDPQ